VLHIEILGHTLRAGWGRDQIEFEILPRNADAKVWICGIRQEVCLEKFKGP
jgi:hypothetical protein